MVRIQKCQARTRIGVMRISGQRGFKKPRTIGEIFELDLDDPIQGAAYKHLIAHGAIKPMGNAIKRVEPVVEERAEPEPEIVESFPVPESEQPTRTCKECKLFNTEDCVHDDPDADAVDRYCFVPVEAEAVITEPEPIRPDTTLVDIFNSHRLEIDFFTEDQIDSLRRIGVVTVADIDNRTDQEMMSLQGIGKGKVKNLRELYDRYGTDDG